MMHAAQWTRGSGPRVTLSYLIELFLSEPVLNRTAVGQARRWQELLLNVGREPGEADARAADQFFQEVAARRGHGDRGCRRRAALSRHRHVPGQVLEARDTKPVA